MAKKLTEDIMAKKLTNDQKAMRKIARKIKTIMDKDLGDLEDSATKGWFTYILKDVYNFVNSASEGVSDPGVADLVTLAAHPPTPYLGDEDTDTSVPEIGDEDS